MKLSTHRKFVFTLWGDIYLRYNSLVIPMTGSDMHVLTPVTSTRATLMSLFAKPVDFDNPPNQISLHCPPVIVVVLTTPNHSTFSICPWTQGVEHEGKGEELWTQQGVRREEEPFSTFPSIQSLDKRSRQQRQKHVDTCMEMVHGDQGNAGNLRGPLQVYAQTGPLRCRHLNPDSVDDGPIQVRLTPLHARPIGTTGWS
ncbi:hypothetical protein BD311DRAFT_827061 [Dichomitus squalens]|uniref:Uncharacterized protein n=1 Tax=Dichomitus squalens TaxID=114155 RepID=A0A4V2JYN5_9APHY|nr:hypothetical protein BD311DRAFT_827061 [Dichomitus squalens]